MIRKPTRRLSVKETYPDGANTPTTVTTHRCFCFFSLRGGIEHHRTPGFDDDFFVITCPRCRKKYDYITQSGYDWEIFPADPDSENDDFDEGEE